MAHFKTLTFTNPGLAIRTHFTTAKKESNIMSTHHKQYQSNVTAVNGHIYNCGNRLTQNTSGEVYVPCIYMHAR